VSVPSDPIPLSHGGPVPRLGLGVFRIPDGRPVRDAVAWALEAGYRHVDTAAMYGNETGVGQAVRESGLARDEIFVTTKLWNRDHGYDRALRAFDASLERLDMERVDLYLVHWPVEGLRLESWRALERILEEGRARAIGVSNYMVRHLEELLAHAHVPPAVNQIELHPFNWRSRRSVLELCREQEIVVEAYSPLTKALNLDEPVVGEVARELERTPAQVLIRYALEKGTVALPKSGDRERIRENGRVFDFGLDEGQLARLDALDRGLAVSWDPTDAP
jgi:diketogulonate reductase-like aldo/keto reductase